MKTRKKYQDLKISLDYKLHYLSIFDARTGTHLSLFAEKVEEKDGEIHLSINGNVVCFFTTKAKIQDMTLSDLEAKP